MRGLTIFSFGWILWQGWGAGNSSLSPRKDKLLPPTLAEFLGSIWACSSVGMADLTLSLRASLPLDELMKHFLTFPVETGQLQ